MEEEPDNKNWITKTEWLPRRITKKLGQSKNINRDGKKSYEKVVWQEKKESIRIKDWRQHVARSQKYPLKITFKEIEPKEI